ncbi:MAG: hypothetical protein VR64_07290 [Desulfatitalea sp. BRH_c12]|nr:MAG: hypothetical protein VR64_07290 [Desulfatitalea sp. BRH_c12]
MEGFGRVISAVEIVRGALEGSINLTELLILAHLASAHPDPVSYADLSKNLGVTVTSVARTIKRLGQHMVQAPNGTWKDNGLGLVAAGPDPYNVRQFVTTLTPAGLKLMNIVGKLLV